MPAFKDFSVFISNQAADSFNSIVIERMTQRKDVYKRQVEAWEAGFETNLLRNRLHFEGVDYTKNTKDLLAEVPGISGTISGLGNLGEIQNKGCL